MRRATSNFFLAPPPAALGPNFVCVLTNEIQNISDGIFILSPGSCPTGGTLGPWGCPGGQQKYVFKHGHVVYQIDDDDEQNRMQVKFLS